jgi:DNA repair exonuclease SbcCD ATPase subunit
MEESKTPKRTRKTKAVKEEHNNIDSITFENTEKDINYKEVSNLEVDSPSEETKETKEKKPKKTPTPRKKKEATPPTQINTDALEQILNEDSQQNIAAMGGACVSETDHTTHPPHTEKIIDSTETPINKYPYSAIITNIYHFSDLHIQLYKRHDEYQVVFDKVINYLKEEKKVANIKSTNNTDIPLIALITGDILHSKSDLSPECVQLTYNFLKAISNIMPLVIIPGNHDINMNNRERLDALTPIISDLPKSNPIYYFLESGVYQISNLLFYHASIFDYQIIPPIKSNSNSNSNSNQMTHTNIMLYHGRVNGAVLFNGLEISEDFNKTVTPSTFAAYDITCLGDIHKHQFLTPNIAYAGSLIQQNLGEDVDNHGLIKWDVASRKGTLIPIKNDSTYITLYVDSKKANHLCSLKDGSHDPNCTLTKNLRVRVLYKNTPESFVSDYITLLKMNHTVHEYSYQNNEQDCSFLENSERKEGDEDFENSNHKGGRSREPSVPSLDITSGELQNKFLIEYITENEPNITPEQIEEIKALNINQNQILKESNKNYNTQGFSGHYKLKRLEFSNLFSFGLRNVIEFTNLKGIVGIIAPNHLGKSAILDIIIYALFDKFTRKGSTKDIINIRSDFFDIRLEVSIGQWTYTICKNGTRNKTNTVSSKIEFFRTHDIEKIVERLEEDNASKTKERISELFGCYEDIINTSFSIQQDNSCFIDSENTDRRKELQRIMRFDIIDKLGDMANQSLTKYKDIREHISKKINNDFIVNTKKAKQKAEKLLALHTENKAYAKGKIKELHESILEISGKLNTDCSKFLKENSKEDTETMLEDLTEQIENNKNESNKIIENLQVLETTSDIKILKDSILDSGVKNSEIIKDAIKKQKALDFCNEKLYKSRKPNNFVLPNNIESGEGRELKYLLELNSKQIEELDLHKAEIAIIENKINILKEKESQIDINNEKILDLEKQMIKLPDSLLELVADSVENLHEEYKCSLENWVDTLDLKTNKNGDNGDNGDNGGITNFDSFLTTSAYKDFETSATQYFVSKEISQYKKSNDTNEEIIIEQQESLEKENQNIKTEMKTIRNLEVQIRQIESKMSTNKIKMQQIENDISNLDTNYKIDDEIALNNKKKEKYDLRISNTEKQNLVLREQSNLLAKYEKLQHEKIYLDKEFISIENVLIQFDKYKNQIEYNTGVQAELDSLKAELADFEDIIEEVEKQFNIENTNLTKNTALLDQIRKDIAENKAIENNLILYTIYRKALKQLPYLLLAKIQPLLEKKVNDLLSIITDFTLKFDMSDSKIDIYIDRSIYKNIDGNSSKLGKMGKITGTDRHILVNNSSGFERFISSLAIRLALLDISNLPKINFMAIDEGWSCFDTTNLNNVGQILDYLKTKFDYILTISHLTEIKQYCDTIISLRKDEKGFSKIIV